MTDSLSTGVGCFVDAVHSLSTSKQGRHWLDPENPVRNTRHAIELIDLYTEFAQASASGVAMTDVDLCRLGSRHP